jgi:amidase
MIPKPWQEIAAAKKAEQLSRIPKEWILTPESIPPPEIVDLRPVAASSGVLSEVELKITGEEYDATSLLSKIADGTYTSVEVVTAFCKRAAVAQQVCNCLTEIMFLDAIEGARKLDEKFKETGKTVGLLHGLPMTFKVSWNTSQANFRMLISRNAFTSKGMMPVTATSPGVSTLPHMIVTWWKSSELLGPSLLPRRTVRRPC